jgi:hypothetical protein
MTFQNLKKLTLFAVAIAMCLYGMVNTAQCAVQNKAVLADISVTDTVSNTGMYSIQLTNGQNVLSPTYIQDIPNNAQYAGGGYGNGVNLGDGTITIQNYTDSQSATHNTAIVMSTSELAPPDGGAPLYFDTAPISSSAINSLRVSFAVNLVSNVGITVNGFNNAAFAANIFANSISATRFIASPTSLTGGVFGLTQAGGAFFPVGTYNNDTFYDIDVDLDFASQTATLSIDGVAGTPIGFRNTFASTPSLTEVFFYQGASTVAPVPEPTTLLVWAGLACCAGLASSRRNRD